MKKSFRKAMAIIISVIMVVASLPICAFASVNYYATVGQGTSGDTVVFPTSGSVKAENCEYVFSGTTAGVGTFVNSSTGTNIYFNISSNSAGCIGSTTAETLTVGANSNFVKKNTFYIKDSSKYAYFWDDNGTKKYRFDRQTSLSTYSQTYFALFTADEGNTTSGIYGYKRVTSVSEITNGKSFLIAHASAYNDDGSLASGASWYVAYPATSSNPYQHVAKVFNQTEVEGATKASVTAYGTIINSGGTSRTSGTALNIVNDGEDSDFDLGFINFDLSNFDSSKNRVSSAIYNFTITVPSSAENKGITFYYATANTDAIKGTGANISGSSSVYSQGTGKHLEKAINHYGLVKLASYSPTTGTTNINYTVDLAPAINYSLEIGEKTAFIIISNSSTGQTSSTGGWTDTTVNVTNTEVYGELKDIDDLSSYTQTFGLVSYDPVIYTKGAYYIYEGSNICESTETNEYETDYTVKDGYKIESITSSSAGDSIVPSSQTGSGHLTGNVYGATASSSKFITITTKLSDDSGNIYIQKDKMYVVTNPVPAHGAGAAYSYKVATGSYYSDYVAFNLVAQGSYPTYGGGSANADQTKGNVPKAGLTTALFSTSTYGDNYDKGQSFITTTEKSAGCFGFYKCNATAAIVNVNSPTANYYFDKSSSKNIGINKTETGSYYITIKYLPQYVFDAGRYLSIYAQNTSSENASLDLTYTCSPIRTNSTGSAENIPVTIKNTAVGTYTGTFSFKEYAISIPGAYLTIAIPINVTICDKSNIRNVYNSYVKKALVSDTFTTDSWNNFYNKMLDVQEYLCKYNYSSTEDEATLIANLDDAYDNLMCKVTLNYADGTSETVERLYNSKIETASIYEQDSEDSSKHIRVSYTWTPDTVTGEITSTQSETTVIESHVWDNGTVTKAATCTTDGEKLYTCECGATKTETVSATGHTLGSMKDINLVPATCISEGSYDKVCYCTVCGEIAFCDHRTIAKTDHTYTYSDNGDGTHTATCSVCGYSLGEKTEHTLVDGVCSYCKAIVLDKTAYESAISEYNSIISDEEYSVKYTSTSRRLYEVAVNNQLNIEFSQQSSVNTATSKILSAKSNLVLVEFNITYDILNINGDVVETKTVSQAYGTSLTLNPSSSVRKWIEIGTLGDSLVSSGQTYTVIPKSEVSLYTVMQDSSVSSTASKVIFKSKGTIVAVKYLESGDSLDTSSVNIPTVPFYKSNGWDKETIVGNGEEITVNAQYIVA